VARCHVLGCYIRAGGCHLSRVPMYGTLLVIICVSKSASRTECTPRSSRSVGQEVDASHDPCIPACTAAHTDCPAQCGLRQKQTARCAALSRSQVVGQTRSSCRVLYTAYMPIALAAAGWVWSMDQWRIQECELGASTLSPLLSFPLLLFSPLPSLYLFSLFSSFPLEVGPLKSNCGIW